MLSFRDEQLGWWVIHSEFHRDGTLWFVRFLHAPTITSPLTRRQRAIEYRVRKTATLAQIYPIHIALLFCNTPHALGQYVNTFCFVCGEKYNVTCSIHHRLQDSIVVMHCLWQVNALLALLLHRYGSGGFSK